MLAIFGLGYTLDYQSAWPLPRCRRIPVHIDLFRVPLLFYLSSSFSAFTQSVHLSTFVRLH